MESIESVTESTSSFLYGFFNNPYINYFMLFCIIVGVLILGFVIYKSQTINNMEVFENYQKNEPN